MILLAGVMVVSLGMAAYNLLEYRRGEEYYDRASQLAGLDQELPHLQLAQPPEGPERNDDPWITTLISGLDLSALQEINEDVKGWILIPGTEVSYPYVQAQDNLYYLRRTWQGDRNISGSIMLEHTNHSDLNDFHTILYGHNMRDGSMFSCLPSYQDAAYREEHPSIYLAKEDGVRRYEVFSVYEAYLDNIVYRLDLVEEGMEQELIDYALEHSVVDTGVVPQQGERLLTLSTCTDSARSKRWVILAVLREEVFRLDALEPGGTDSTDNTDTIDNTDSPEDIGNTAQ